MWGQEEGRQGIEADNGQREMGEEARDQAIISTFLRSETMNNEVKQVLAEEIDGKDDGNGRPLIVPNQRGSSLPLEVTRHRLIDFELDGLGELVSLPLKVGALREDITALDYVVLWL